MDVFGQKMGVAHRHLYGPMTQDALQRCQIAGRLQEDAREPMPQVVAPVREANLPGEPSKMP